MAAAVGIYLRGGGGAGRGCNGGDACGGNGNGGGMGRRGRLRLYPAFMSSSCRSSRILSNWLSNGHGGEEALQKVP